MCGLAGIISTEKIKNRRIVFASMMLSSVSRGRDSTGVLSVENAKTGPKFLIEKEASHAYDFFRSKDGISVLMDDTVNSFLGHVRAATIGKVEKATAHPYHFGNIIGFHNGTIRGYKTADDLTDSSRFYSEVSKKGFLQALQDLPYDSAYCFVFWDGENDTYHFFRNTKRELHIAKSKDQKTLVYASEKRFIKAALEFAELDGFEEPELLERNTLLHVKCNEASLSIRPEKDYLAKDVIERHEKVYESRGYGSYSYYGQKETTREETYYEGTNIRRFNPPSHPPVRRHDTSAHRRSGTSLTYPCTRFEYNPCNDVVMRTIWRNPSHSQKTYFYRSNPQFNEVYETCKREIILDAGGLYIELDEETWDFSVYSKKWAKPRKITTSNQRWDGWYAVREMIDSLWESQAIEDSCNNRQDFVPPQDCIMTWNQMHSMAAQRSTPGAPPKLKEGEFSKKEVDELLEGAKEERPADDSEEEIQIPFDMTGQAPYYTGFTQEELSLEQAGRLLYTGCMNCIEQSTVNDVVFWTGPRNYICQPCSHLNVVQESCLLDNARQGRLIHPVFEAREVLN